MAFVLSSILLSALISLLLLGMPIRVEMSELTVLVRAMCRMTKGSFGMVG